MHADLNFSQCVSNKHQCALDSLCTLSTVWDFTINPVVNISHMMTSSVILNTLRGQN